MVEYFISFILAFIVAFSATPIAKKIAFKIGAVDVPKDDRRMHKKPIARLGGLAIVVAFLVSTLFNMTSTIAGIDAMTADRQFWGMLAGIIIIVAVGIIDDVKQLGAKLKFLIQVIAAVIVVWTGTSITFVTNPLAANGMSNLSPVISFIVTVLWIVGITNAINLIDGLDGLAAGVSSIASLSLFIVSVLRGEFETALITAALAGSALGFLPYNFNPAKIFMGDTGATFLGFTLGVVSIQGTLKQYTAIAIAIPLLILGLPLFDTIFAILRRVLQGKSPMQADRGHLHHRLIDMGLSHKQSVVVMYTVSSALGLCAIVLADKGVLSAIILVVSVSVFVIAGARYMTEIDSAHREETPAQPEKEDEVSVNEVSDLNINKQ